MYLGLDGPRDLDLTMTSAGLYLLAGSAETNAVANWSGLVENNEVIDRYGLVKAEWRT